MLGTCSSLEESSTERPCTFFPLIEIIWSPTCRAPVLSEILPGLMLETIIGPPGIGLPNRRNISKQIYSTYNKCTYKQ